MSSALRGGAAGPSRGAGRFRETGSARASVKISPGGPGGPGGRGGAVSRTRRTRGCRREGFTVSGQCLRDPTEDLTPASRTEPGLLDELLGRASLIADPVDCRTCLEARPCSGRCAPNAHGPWPRGTTAHPSASFRTPRSRPRRIARLVCWVEHVICETPQPWCSALAAGLLTRQCRPTSPQFLITVASPVHRVEVVRAWVSTVTGGTCGEGGGAGHDVDGVFVPCRSALATRDCGVAAESLGGRLDDHAGQHRFQGGPFEAWDSDLCAPLTGCQAIGESLGLVSEELGEEVTESAGVARTGDV